MFKCKHPFSSLVIQKIHTCIPSKENELPAVKKAGDTYVDIDYHFYCTKCGAGDLTISFASRNGYHK